MVRQRSFICWFRLCDNLILYAFQNNDDPDTLVNLIVVSGFLGKPEDVINRYIRCVGFIAGVPKDRVSVWSNARFAHIFSINRILYC